MLSPGVEENRDIPKEYNMHITDPTAVNTFVFTEKDLPGYKKYSHDRAPPRSSRGRIDKYRKTDQTNFRKAIPSRSLRLVSRDAKRIADLHILRTNEFNRPCSNGGQLSSC